MAITKAAPARRMGPAGSDVWHAMLDGAEDILREQGHAALTSRLIAERIGVKQRLVYYYFHTMDDLVAALFRRSSERDLQRLEDVSTSERPLSQLWQLCYRSADARLISEYMALANRIPDLRNEVVKFIERSRSIQVRVITDALARQGSDQPGRAEAIAITAISLGLSLNREEQLGISSGHDAVREAVERILNTLDGP